MNNAIADLDVSAIDTFKSHPQSWIAGRWVSGERDYPVIDPAQGIEIARVGVASIADVDEAVTAAGTAFDKHRSATPDERARWCFAASTAILAHEHELAAELTREHGKPLLDALAEVRSAANGFRVAATVALADSGAAPRVADPTKRVIVRREPRGVWAVVTPWNFPLNIPMEYIGPAISTGNAVVWKPAPSTSRIAALFRAVLLEADFPQDLIQLVLTDDLDTARYLTMHPVISSIGFTGGSAAGESIRSACSDKHLLLELGGNTPMVVFADADLDQTADAIANAAFWNTGQVCSAAGRILVDRRVSGELAERLASRARARQTGDPFDPATEMGPVHLESGIARIQAHIDDATERGATLLTGGRRSDGAGWYFPATVLADVSPEAVIANEETFGPVAALVPLDESDLVAAANDGEFGLVGAVFTTSLDRAFTTAEAIDAGLVIVNATSNYWELSLPFGGAHGRRSGRGRLGGVAALDEFTQLKTIVLTIR